MNCNNTIKLAWVDGNDVILKVRMYEKTLSGQTVTETPFDLSACDSVAVTLCRTFETYTLEYAIDQTEDNCLVVVIPYTIPRGKYSLAVAAQLDDFRVRSFEGGLLAIVKDNSEAITTFSEVDGARGTDTRLTFQMVPDALVRGQNSYEAWKELPGNEGKTLQDYIDEVLDLNGITAECLEATDAANTAAENAKADYVGADGYVYRWNVTTQQYEKTDLYVKGAAGSPGADAVEYEIVANTLVVNRTNSNNPTPNQLVFDAYKITGGQREMAYGPLTLYQGPNRTQESQSFDGHLVMAGSSWAYVQPPYVCELVIDNVLVATCTVVEVKNGADGSDADVTAENIASALGYTPMADDAVQLEETTDGNEPALALSINGVSRVIVGLREPAGPEPYIAPSWQALIDYAENKYNKVTSISAQSTDTQYPSAKCVYDMMGDVESLLAAI